MLALESTEDQQIWIEFILSYENWRMDKTPNKFKICNSYVYWLKSNGKQRIRISEYEVTFYNKEDGIDEIATYRTMHDSTDKLKVILDNMHDKMLAGRENSLKGLHGA